MMDTMVKLTEQLVRTENGRADIEAKQQQRKDEAMFKVDTNLPELHGNVNEAHETIMGLERFEKVLTEAKVTTRSVWVRLFRKKLKGIAKTWIEAALMREPGVSLHAQALHTDLPAKWDELYAHLRARLLAIGAVNFEDVQEKAEAAWKAVKFTDKAEALAIQKSIEDITKAWQRMCEVSMFTPGDVESDKRLMRDLRRKVPESSQLKMWFISKD